MCREKPFLEEVGNGRDSLLSRVFSGSSRTSLLCGPLVYPPLLFARSLPFLALLFLPNVVAEKKSICDVCREDFLSHIFTLRVQLAIEGGAEERERHFSLKWSERSPRKELGVIYSRR